MAELTGAKSKGVDMSPELRDAIDRGVVAIGIGVKLSLMPISEQLRLLPLAISTTAFMRELGLWS